MNKIKIILIIILLIIISTKSYTKEKIFIIYNINNELITNIDLNKESNYLIALNNQLKNLDKKSILGISKESIMRETIKKIELSQYFDLERKNPLVDNYIKNFFLRLNLKNEEEFKKYLKNYGLTADFVRKKIQVEITWNKFIYDKFQRQIKIDKEEMLKEIKSNQNETNKKIYSLSEIVFEVTNQASLNKKKDNIDKSIKEIGFKNSANIYSISDSSKFGGEIGWIEEKGLSKKILIEINDLEIGRHTKPIQTGSSFLIIKVDDIKYEKKVKNIKEELNKKIQIETERQLQQFSKIYYNKIKINMHINEL
ncbi:peptidylprolyl isomerase [Pelagibacteraceae bacterium]|nr:peptidylprolyl isomerase [Pelagibacteraceae bacterium]